MPEEVRLDFGRRLNLAQRGMTPPSTKPWKGAGPNVLEMVREFGNDAFRAVYTVRFNKAVYVLHAFQKKSPKGRKTDRRDVEAVERALRGAQEHYRVTYESEVGR
jgi:phage-related protein